jgi:hypothetical protein
MAILAADVRCGDRRAADRARARAAGRPLDEREAATGVSTARPAAGLAAGAPNARGAGLRVPRILGRPSG